MALDPRTRPRKDALKIKSPTDIVDRVIAFHAEDLAANQTDRDLRLQRIAKYRMWVEGKDWPWEGASDIPLPDMMEKSLRVQDTLHNAVMSQIPVVGAKAVNKADAAKEQTVDDLIHFQIFAEQNGENIMGNLADAFVNDGVFTAFIPWVKEFRSGSERREFESIPEDSEPGAFFETILSMNWPGHDATGGPWDWKLEPKGPGIEVPQRVEFYTRDDGKVEALVKRPVQVFDGPRIIVKDYEQVLHPPRVENLQPPGPSNPNGSPHVILVDYPTIDEVKRLARSMSKATPFYDMVSKEELEKLENFAENGSDDGEREQRDAMSGTDASPTMDKKAKSQQRLTRLTCFDTYDIDGDGLADDVIWWVLLEPKVLLKGAMLGDMYPASPPRRPFAEAQFIPVRGRRNGISLLEIMEGLHDSMKEFFDRTADAGTVANSPFFFYRPSGGMKPETIRLWPGEGYPLMNPQQDVHFPQIGNQAQAFGINMITMISQMQERLTMVGDLQLGRIPGGGSSALRTIGNMAMAMGQGEERPERILRRFFMGIGEIYTQIHELNQYLLPEKKEFRILGKRRKFEDPFQEVAKRDDIKARFQFTFGANVLNTSKQMLQQSLGAMSQMFVSELMVQLGIVRPEGIYQLMRDLADAFGQDGDKYLSEPFPGASEPPIFAEDAISMVRSTQEVEGRPAEAGGAQEHLQKIIAFTQNDMMFSELTPQQIEILGNYIKKVQGVIQQEQQQKQMLQAAQKYSQQQGAQGQGQVGRPPEQPPQGQQGPPMISGGNELLDETLPSAGGGGAGGPVQ